MPKSITVYPEDGPKYTVRKDDLTPMDTPALNFHERIIKTYYELELEGKLNDMSPREKQRTRQIHEDAQNPAYWGEKNTLGYTDAK